MTQSATSSTDYTLRPSGLAPVLALLVEARRPCIVWGPPGAAKSMIAQQVASGANRRYVDVPVLLLDTHVVSTHCYELFFSLLQIPQAFRQRLRFKYSRVSGPPLRLLVESVLSRCVGSVSG